MQAICATMQSPATQGDQVGSLNWMRTPSTVSGLSEIPFSPDARQDGFMTEALGMAQALGVAPFASSVTGTPTLSTGQPPHDSNASATSASKPTADGLMSVRPARQVFMPQPIESSGRFPGATAGPGGSFARQ